jgi:hypothetical protein
MDFKHRIVAITLRSGLLACVLALSAGTCATAADTVPAAQTAPMPQVDTSAQTTAGTPQGDSPGVVTAGVATPGVVTPGVATPAAAGDATPAADAAGAAAPASDFKTLDQEVQGMKKDVIDLNKDLFVLQEELLFPANTQVAVYVSMDVGTFFALDSVTLKIDNKEVKNYLYTAREAQALLKGGVQEIYLGNLKVGKHELVAFFTGKGPVERDYKRGATITFEKGVGAKYLELKITDRVTKHQPEFKIKDWE